MIEFDDVVKRYVPARGRPRLVEALRHVTVRIAAGGVHAVVGPNGAGKTTLFALLLGFLHPTAGRVRIQGLAPRRYVRRHGAGYLPERFRLPGEWRVDAALRALARLEGLSPGTASSRARQALERFGLGEHAGKEIRTLSRGLLQRLGLAQALLAERELVVLDEPTEGLDPLWRIRMRAAVDELRRAGRTVLLASHELAEVERMADRVILMQGGEIRDVLEVRGAAGAAGGAVPPRRYRLELAAPNPLLEELFPGAVFAGADDAAAYLVEASDPAELSARVAALLAAGAVISAIVPAHEPLESRVRRALQEAGGDE